MSDIPQEIQKLKDLISSSERILITSHISPDPDAVSSVLLLGMTLKANYPGKQIKIVLEEKPSRNLDFLPDYQAIEFEPTLEAVQRFEPNLLFIVDAHSYERISRDNGRDLQAWIAQHDIKSIVIDHHEQLGRNETAVYINNHFPATTQEIYHIVFSELDLRQPEHYAELTLLGIISDTSRFKYANSKHRETFALVDDLLDTGADIEELEGKIEAYSKDQLIVLAHLITNLDQTSGYNSSFITDEFAKSWLSDGKDPDDYSRGIDLFKNDYLRYIYPNSWGLIVFAELVPGQRNYSASFRALGDVKDVSVIAARLGGGGHKPAAAAKFEAGSIEEAIKKVKAAIGDPEA